jgi:hypothetical protein
MDSMRHPAPQKSVRLTLAQLALIAALTAGCGMLSEGETPDLRTGGDDALSDADPPNNEGGSGGSTPDLYDDAWREAEDTNPSANFADSLLTHLHPGSGFCAGGVVGARVLHDSDHGTLQGALGAAFFTPGGLLRASRDAHAYTLAVGDRALYARPIR